MMGHYYDAQAVRTRGKPMRNQSPDPAKRAFLYFKHRLVAVMSNGIREIAPDITDQDEHQALWDAYSCGVYLSFDLYDFNPD
jgi:hypothetical protein